MQHTSYRILPTTIESNFTVEFNFTAKRAPAGTPGELVPLRHHPQPQATQPYAVPEALHTADLHVELSLLIWHVQRSDLWCGGQQIGCSRLQCSELKFFKFKFNVTYSFW